MVWGMPEFQISDLGFGLRSARVSDLWSALGLRRARVSNLWSPLWSKECHSFRSLISPWSKEGQSFKSLISAMVWGMPSRVSYLWSPLWSEECQMFHITDLRCAIVKKTLKLFENYWVPDLVGDLSNARVPIHKPKRGLRSARESDIHY
jgi:hypothetical protein